MNVDTRLTRQPVIRRWMAANGGGVRSTDQGLRLGHYFGTRWAQRRAGWLPSLVLAVALGILLQVGSARALPAGFVDQLVADGLVGPTAMAFAPDGRLFVTEQGGALRVVKGGGLQRAPFVQLTVDSTGERGLLGVAIDPDFAANRFVYLYHTVPESPSRNRISRFTASGDVAQSGSRVTILDLDALSSATIHNGGAIHFGPDGKLYVGVGDNGQGSNAQSLSTRFGKVLRINRNGTTPADNPLTFRGVAGRTAGANRAIWAVGLRNPFTFAIQRFGGVMFINDVGQDRFEEVNRGLPGRNYGWPLSEGPSNLPILTDPHFYYAHSSGAPADCAISGGTFYNPPTREFPDKYVGKYFFADFCGGWIYYLDPAIKATATRFHSGLNNPVDLAVGRFGRLYYLQRGNGQVRRVIYNAD